MRMGRMVGVDPSPSMTAKRRVRRTLFVVALILVVTVLLVAVKYWVVSRYLLGH